jgi:sulfur-oxidizing protein SoxX
VQEIWIWQRTIAITASVAEKSTRPSSQHHKKETLEDTMRKAARFISTAGAMATIIGALSATPQLAAAADAQVMAEGKKIAFDRKKGNCLACHHIEGGQAAGNIGPALVAMKARFPEKAALRAQVWDATAKNSNTMMPPFGRHEILTESEIDKVVEFIYSL